MLILAAVVVGGVLWFGTDTVAPKVKSAAHKVAGVFKRGVKPAQK
jgi:hypothetical protein